MLLYINKISCYYTSLLYCLYHDNIKIKNAVEGLIPETDFYYDKQNIVYNSKTLLLNLKKLGYNVKYNKFCDNNKNNGFFDKVSVGDFVIVGMDCFNIKWHHLYKRENIIHYFPVLKMAENKYIAYDPIYKKYDILVDIDYIIKYSIEIKHIKKTKNTYGQNENDYNDIDYIYKKLDEIKQKVSQGFRKYIKNSLDKRYNFGQYVLALLNNRYLTLNLLAINCESYSSICGEKLQSDSLRANTPKNSNFKNDNKNTTTTTNSNTANVKNTVNNFSLNNTVDNIVDNIANNAFVNISPPPTSSTTTNATNNTVDNTSFNNNAITYNNNSNNIIEIYKSDILNKWININYASQKLYLYPNDTKFIEEVIKLLESAVESEKNFVTNYYKVLYSNN